MSKHVYSHITSWRNHYLGDIISHVHFFPSWMKTRITESVCWNNSLICSTNRFTKWIGLPKGCDLFKSESASGGESWKFLLNSLTGLRRSQLYKAVAKKHGKHGTHSDLLVIQRLWMIFWRYRVVSCNGSRQKKRAESEGSVLNAAHSWSKVSRLGIMSTGQFPGWININYLCWTSSLGKHGRNLGLLWWDVAIFNGFIRMFPCVATGGTLLQ